MGCDGMRCDVLMCCDGMMWCACRYLNSCHIILSDNEAHWPHLYDEFVFWFRRHHGDADTATSTSTSFTPYKRWDGTPVVDVPASTYDFDADVDAPLDHGVMTRAAPSGRRTPPRVPAFTNTHTTPPRSLPFATSHLSGTRLLDRSTTPSPIDTTDTVMHDVDMRGGAMDTSPHARTRHRMIPPSPTGADGDGFEVFDEKEEDGELSCVWCGMLCHVACRHVLRLPTAVHSDMS